MRELLINNVNYITVKSIEPILNQCKINFECNDGFSLEVCNNNELNLKLLQNLCPNFCAVPWHLKSYDDLNSLDISALHLANYLASHGQQVVLHLAAKNLTQQEVLKILHAARCMGLRNIFALQGGKLF